jgi:hypothetical protein
MAPIQAVSGDDKADDASVRSGGGDGRVWWSCRVNSAGPLLLLGHCNMGRRELAIGQSCCSNGCESIVAVTVAAAAGCCTAAVVDDFSVKTVVVA